MSYAGCASLNCNKQQNLTNTFLFKLYLSKMCNQYSYVHDKFSLQYYSNMYVPTHKVYSYIITHILLSIMNNSSHEKKTDLSKYVLIKYV